MVLLKCTYESLYLSQALILVLQLVLHSHMGPYAFEIIHLSIKTFISFIISNQL
jgi:hypothetical protein